MVSFSNTATSPWSHKWSLICKQLLFGSIWSNEFLIQEIILCIDERGYTELLDIQFRQTLQWARELSIDRLELLIWQGEFGLGIMLFRSTSPHNILWRSNLSPDSALSSRFLCLRGRKFSFALQLWACNSFSWSHNSQVYLKRGERNGIAIDEEDSSTTTFLSRFSKSN